MWTLASAPAFNPNAMTLGTTLGGAALASPSAQQIINNATLGAYPAGSSFKPFTLAAAYKTGVAGPGTRMPCPGTWTFSGFTFHNYEDHVLPGQRHPAARRWPSAATRPTCRSRCMVYERDQTALTDLIAEFGFGAFTGIRHLPEESGILPDAAYFEETERWDGRIVPYNEFDQIQLSIGQGSYTGTMLQLANAYAAIGNGGTLWTPRIVTQAVQPDGTVVERIDPKETRKISLTPAQLALVTDSLEAVVTLPYGTARSAFAGFGAPGGRQERHRRDGHAGSARPLPGVRAGRRPARGDRDGAHLHAARDGRREHRAAGQIRAGTVLCRRMRPPRWSPVAQGERWRVASALPHFIPDQVVLSHEDSR